MSVLDRTIAPEIRQLDDFLIVRPERRQMRNGMPLFTIQAGSEDVVRFDLVIRSGQLQQDRPLQAVFTNRMLREGCRRKWRKSWTITEHGLICRFQWTAVS